MVTAGFPSPSVLARQMSDACRELLRGKKAAHIGIGVAGDIDSARGIVRVSPNLGWKRVPLKRLMERFLHCRVSVENDAKAAAWGLYRTQVSPSVKNLLVLTLGTGVGGGIILNGSVYRGATGSAGEIGHMIINENGPLCNCGNRGCLETFVGAPHITRKVREDLERGQASSLQSLVRENPDQLSPYMLAVAANNGDAYAQSVWEGVGHALGVALGNFVYLFNPEMIYLTGGVSQANRLILTPLWQTLKTRTFKTPIGAVQIKTARGAAHIGVIGASLL